MTATQERKALVWLFILVAILTSLPYLVGFSSQTEEWRFSGFLIGVDDGNSYIAKMLRGSEGDWIFRSPYSVVDQKGLLVFLPYIWLGKLASAPANHTQLVLLFQGFRIFGLGVYMYGIHRFMRLFSLSPSLRILGVFLAVVGGGTGWLMLFFQKVIQGDGIPLEFTSPETFGFLSVFTLPHLATATGLLFLALEKYLAAAKMDLGDSKRNSTLVLGGVALFLAGLFQLIDVAVGLFLIGVISIMGIIQSRADFNNQVKHLRGVIVSLIPALAWVGYVLIAGSTDPFLQGWNAQNTITSPPPVYYLFSLGVFYLVCIVNYKNLRVAISSIEVKFSLLWGICVPILVYLPISIQRRLAVGIWVVLLVLLLLSLKNLTQSKQSVWMGALIIISLPSTILIWVTSLNASRNLTSPIFVSREYVDTYESFNEQGSNVKVLTLFRTGNEMPAWVPVSVTLGLGPESVPYGEMEDLSDRFYSGVSTIDDRRKLIDDYGVRFGVVGAREINQYPSASKTLVNAKTVYKNDTVRIVEILP